MAAYFWLFHTAPLPSLPLEPNTGEAYRRADFLPFALLPEEIVRPWFGDPPAIAFADRLPIFGLALALLFVAHGLGRILLRAACLDERLTRIEATFFSFAVGLSGVSLYTLLIGLTGELRQRWLFFAPALAVVLVNAYGWFATRGAATWRWPSRAAARDELRDGGWWLFVAAPFVVVTLLGAALPPTDFDVREYHLEAPKEFFLTGEIRFTPHNVYENMPLASEMLALACMVAIDDWWTGALAGKVVIASFAPLAALGLIAAARRFFSPAVGYLAAAVYLSTPWIVRVSAAGLVDGAAAFYLFAAAFAALVWSDEVSVGRARTWRMAALAGWLAGAAIATKYPGLLFVAAPLGVWMAWASRRAQRSVAMSGLLAYAVACAAASGPWFARNAVASGNPTYPLLSSLFGNPIWSAEQMARWNAAHRPSGFGWDAFTSSLADLAWRSEWTSPALVPLALVGLCVAWRRPRVTWLAGYIAFVLVSWWLFTHRIDRFWLPVVPLISLLAGCSMFAGVAMRRVCVIAAAVALASNLLFVLPQTSGNYTKYFVPLARLRVDRRRVDPWHLELNRRVSSGQSVLCVGDAEVFDLEMPVHYATPFDTPVIEIWAGDGSAESLREALAAHDVAYVYVDWDEIDRYRSPGNYGFSDFVTRERLAGWVAAGVLERPLPAIEGHAGEVYPVSASGAIHDQSNP